MSHEWHYMRSWQHVGSTSCFWRVFTRIYITKSGGIFLIGKLVRFHVIDLWATYAYQWDGERFSPSQALHDCIWCSNIMSNFPSFGLAMNWQLGLLFQTVNIQVAHGWPNMDCWVPMLLTIFLKNIQTIFWDVGMGSYRTPVSVQFKPGIIWTCWHIRYSVSGSRIIWR